MNILPKPLSSQKVIRIQPFYHPSNWKRLLGKVYFSAGRCIGAFIRSAQPKSDGALKNFDYGGATVGANHFLIL